MVGGSLKVQPVAVHNSFPSPHGNYMWEGKRPRHRDEFGPSGIGNLPHSARFRPRSGLTGEETRPVTGENLPREMLSATARYACRGFDFKPSGAPLAGLLKLHNVMLIHRISELTCACGASRQ